MDEKEINTFIIRGFKVILEKWINDINSIIRGSNRLSLNSLRNEMVELQGDMD